MITVVFAHFAQKAILENKTNNVSLINIVDTFFTKTFPFIVPELAFVLKTKRDIEIDPNEAEFEITIQQDDSKLLSHKGKVYYQDKEFNNLVMTFAGLVIPKPLPLVLICKKDNVELATLTINVKQIGPEIVQEDTVPEIVQEETGQSDSQ